MCYYDSGLNSSLYYIFCDFELQGLMKTKKKVILVTLCRVHAHGKEIEKSLPCACTRQRVTCGASLCILAFLVTLYRVLAHGTRQRVTISASHGQSLPCACTRQRMRCGTHLPALCRVFGMTHGKELAGGSRTSVFAVCIHTALLEQCRVYAHGKE